MTENQLGELEMTENQLVEIMRISYLAGVDDSVEGHGQWCAQGSLERAQELLEEFKGDDLIPALNKRNNARRG